MPYIVAKSVAIRQIIKPKLNLVFPTVPSSLNGNSCTKRH